METVVDARGLACPQPVVNTKRALEAAGEGVVVTIVDNEVARDNVVRFARSQGLRAEVEEKGSEYYIRISRTGFAELSQQANPALVEVLLVTGAALGRGDEELGRVLMQSFLTTLAQSEHLPRKILLLNSGVRLACEGSPVLDSLLALESKGVEIVACGTCLDYYGLKESLCVGSVTNMYSIVEALAEAEKILHL
ncbi:MAG: sulfurtransferase-like selenium metabolism protein YedF [Clostridia bacterium]|jgi:selenium metabolism protein YedF|nr:sulfurtransferase-like selenium metabolism protein YedF [Clostridia bacterium]MDH7573369.1 sulfurtransferase-like selenium metabolism protein YedF [Clostridia bacterium]